MKRLVNLLSIFPVGLLTMAVAPQVFAQNGYPSSYTVPVTIVNETGDLTFIGDSIPLSVFQLRTPLGNAPTTSELRLSIGELNQRLNGIENRLDGIGERLNEIEQRLDGLNEKLNEAIALSSALDFQRPAPGKNYRVFTGFGQFQDKTAVGVGLTGILCDFDYGIGVSISTNQVLTKGSVGWSF